MTTTDAPTTFDGSQQPPQYPQEQLPHAGDISVNAAHGLTGLTALDAIGAQIEERDAEEETTVNVEVPGLKLRLVCSTLVPYQEYQRWQMAALPMKERKSRRPKPLSMSQLVLACMVLVETCEAIEHQVEGEWKPLIGTDGEPYTLRSEELLRRFQVIDVNQFIGRLFGRDPHVLKAAERVMIASNWLEDEDGDLDPTE
jgi:hypothetical protein